MVKKNLLRSLNSPKDLATYLEARYELSSKPSQSRWGIASISCTFFSFLIALSVGFIAVSLAIFGGFGGGEMTSASAVLIIAWVIVVLAALTAMAGIYGLVVILQLANYWLKNPHETTTDETLKDTRKGVIQTIPKGIRKLENKIDKGLRKSSKTGQG